MKRVAWMVVASCMLWAGQALAVQGNVNFLLGQKSLDSSDWGQSNWGESYDQQGELGVLFDIGDESWPISLAVDLLGSAKQWDYWWGTATASTAELDLGVRKVFNLGSSSVHPYVGGGVAFVSARYEEKYDIYYYTNEWSTSDGGTGIWINGGIYYSFWEHFNVGMDVRFTRADVTLINVYGDPVEVAAGGNHVGLVMGYRW